MGRVQQDEAAEVVGSVKQEGVSPDAVPFPPPFHQSPVGYGGAALNSPVPHQINPSSVAVGEPWTTGLFDCQLHQTNAVMTAFLPCVTFGQIAEMLDEGEMTCPLGSFLYLLMMPALCTQWIMGSKYRKKLRKKYNLVEAPYEDWASALFCPCCSLCQEFRELKNRGIDPALGWNGYLAQQQATQRKYQAQVMSPPNNQSMHA